MVAVWNQALEVAGCNDYSKLNLKMRHVPDAKLTEKPAARPESGASPAELVKMDLAVVVKSHLSTPAKTKKLSCSQL